MAVGDGACLTDETDFLLPRQIAADAVQGDRREAHQRAVAVVPDPGQSAAQGGHARLSSVKRAKNRAADAEGHIGRGIGCVPVPVQKRSHHILRIKAPAARERIHGCQRHGRIVAPGAGRLAVEKARNADIVLVFGGLNKHRYQDTENYDRKDYEMPYNQNELVEALLAVNKNIVFVNISGNSMAMPWAKKVPAILQAWYLGSETGRIIGGILAGDVNPSGKLPYTWGQKLTDYGAHALNTYPGIKRANEEIYDEEYKEGIYVGYRWIDKEKIKPLFSFGHGLSYTTFKIGKVSADKKEVSQDGQITFTVNVQNTGKRAGAEVVQLYISDLKASVDRPAKELKGFKKVYLQPGESKDVSISIRKDALSFYDETIHSWKAEAGEFEALVGNAADNICSKVKFTLR